MLKAWIISAAIGGSALAQTPQPAQPRSTGRPEDPNSRLVRMSEANQRLQKMTRLPQQAQEVRDKGVPAPEMKEALQAAKAKGVKAHEMADVTAEQSKAIDEHGRIDNFGAFVKGKLNEGLRGRELAAAIREENAKRGIGHHGKGKGNADKEKDKDRDNAGKGRPDRDDDGGNGKGKGKPDNAGKGQGKGRGKP